MQPEPSQPQTWPYRLPPAPPRPPGPPGQGDNGGWDDDLIRQSSCRWCRARLWITWLGHAHTFLTAQRCNLHRTHRCVLAALHALSHGVDP